MAKDSNTLLQALINRMNAGEPDAREELIALAYDRLGRLTRKIIQDFRRVNHFEDSGDILHHAALRLLPKLQAARVESVAKFFSLAAHEIRLALIELTRHHHEPAGQGTKENDVENHDGSALAKDSNAQLQALVNRMNAGETGAREELIVLAYDRLGRLTRKIFQDFRRVNRYEDSGDILHNAVLRLLRRLQAVRVESVADFFSLSAHEIRLALLDIARHYYGPAGPATNERAVEKSGAQNDDALTSARDALSLEPSQLAVWTEFHERAESLPVMERCIFDLLWYHGMTQEEAAQVLNVSLATIKRHWLTARTLLQDFLGGTKLPG